MICSAFGMTCYEQNNGLPPRDANIGNTLLIKRTYVPTTPKWSYLQLQGIPKHHKLEKYESVCN